MTKINRKTHLLDAADKPLGRLASKVALLLRGKHKIDFTPNFDNGDFVIIKNIDKIKFTGKKIKQKIYHHYSGYPGGLKTVPLDKLFKKNPKEVLRRAVWRMLPKNRLREKMIKRLIIK